MKMLKVRVRQSPGELLFIRGDVVLGQIIPSEGPGDVSGCSFFCFHTVSDRVISGRVDAANITNITPYSGSSSVSDMDFWTGPGSSQLGFPGEK